MVCCSERGDDVGVFVQREGRRRTFYVVVSYPLTILIVRVEKTPFEFMALVAWTKTAFASVAQQQGQTARACGEPS